MRPGRDRTSRSPATVRKYAAGAGGAGGAHCGRRHTGSGPIPGPGPARKDSGHTREPFRPRGRLLPHGKRPRYRARRRATPGGWLPCADACTGRPAEASGQGPALRLGLPAARRGEPCRGGRTSARRGGARPPAPRPDRAGGTAPGRPTAPLRPRGAGARGDAVRPAPRLPPLPGPRRGSARRDAGRARAPHGRAVRGRRYGRRRRARHGRRDDRGPCGGHARDGPVRAVRGAGPATPRGPGRPARRPPVGRLAPLPAPAAPDAAGGGADPVRGAPRPVPVPARAAFGGLRPTSPAPAVDAGRDPASLRHAYGRRRARVRHRPPSEEHPCPTEPNT